MIRSIPRGRPSFIYSQRRFFFSKFKDYKKVKAKLKESTENSKVFLPEYSVTPDTYTYKITENNDPLNKGYESNAIAAVYNVGTEDPLNGATPNEFYENHSTIDSKRLRRKNIRPTKCKMLTSDFIEDSLYNPGYGYFSKQVEIFHQARPFDYNQISDIDDFMNHWARSYKKYDENHEKLKKIENIDKNSNIKSTKPSLQLWHTPTELFQPYYGEALARYLLVNYKLNQYPYKDLIIYEMGGGNGTLMCNILNYIKIHQPDIYLRTKYKIIEISTQLAEKQMKSALKEKLVKLDLDLDKVEIINKSIFDWDKKVPEPCFFIGLEVFDNFSHDAIRFDTQTGEPYQGSVVIDKNGDFREFYTKDLSYYAELFLKLRENGRFPILNGDTLSTKLKSLIYPQKIHPLNRSRIMTSIRSSFWPFRSHLSDPEFVPTRLIEFFNILKHYFPEHQLLTSDFNELPNATKGYNAPVVQTMLDNKMVTTSTYMVHQGYFDIMFPTDFRLSADLYRQIVGKVAKVESHRDFLEQWGDIDVTTTKKGDNPMLDFYSNASFLIS